MANTEIDYVYRDLLGEEKKLLCVVEGSVSKGQYLEIQRCMKDGNKFIPEQVDLPPVERPGEFEAEDTVYCEMLGMTPTKKKPTIPISAHALMGKFLRAAGKWDEDFYAAVATERAWRRQRGVRI